MDGNPEVMPEVREVPHFSESEIVEITWLNAVHNYYNLMNIPLEIESDGYCWRRCEPARGPAAASL